MVLVKLVLQALVESFDIVIMCSYSDLYLIGE